MIGEGWDTIQEAYDVTVSAGLLDLWDDAQQAAKDISDDGEGRVLIHLAGEPWQMSARGARGGVKYWLDSDDGALTLHMRSPKMRWCLSVRYNAVGLWRHGVRALRERVQALLRRLFLLSGTEQDHCRLSLAHFAVDSWSPDFSQTTLPEFLEGFCCHQEVKAKIDQSIPFQGWVRSQKFETITIGPRSGLQIQVYDKGKEIVEASGKAWMLDVWTDYGWKPDELQKPTDCWRVEIRLGRDFLRERNILTFNQLQENLSSLLSEALQTRRLAVKADDDNRCRWPTHWFWAHLLEVVGDLEEWCGTGRVVQAQGDYLSDTLKKNLAGTLRSLVVLHCGDYDSILAQQFIGEIRVILETDTKHFEKVDKCSLRYSNIHASNIC